MSDERKKFTVYLHPGRDVDRQALAVIDSVGRSARGDLYRQALIAGIALYHLDGRLPALLTALFTENLNSDQVVGAISQTTGWRPSEADIKMVLNILGAIPKQEDAQAIQRDMAQESLALREARNKLAGLI